MTDLDRNDAKFMAKAISLAKKGRYTVAPNPCVGCVLVKNNELLAEGWHMFAGKGHAEVEALKQTTEAQGATAYVTLEPCSHYGRTPPCAEALVQAGVKRVVIAMQDPNPLVAGKGISLLKNAGIEVCCGVLESEAMLLNVGFIKRMQTGLPYVVSKFGMSADGKTAMASGESKWITSAEARQDVQWLRAENAAIMSGVNTVLADNPSLNVRLADDSDVTQPIRVILDSHLKTPIDAKILTLTGRTLILTCIDNTEKQIALQHAGAEIYCLRQNKEGRLDLLEVLRFLGTQQINSVLIEAGGILNGALMLENLIDECIVYMAPCFLGSDGRGLFETPSMMTMSDKKKLKLCNMRQIGVDLRLQYKVQK